MPAAALDGRPRVRDPPRRQFPEAVAAEAEACPDLVRRDHLRFYARQRPDDEARTFILREDPRAEALVEVLDPVDEVDRRLSVGALDDADVALPVARALHRRTTAAPTREEFAGAAAAYAREDSPEVRHHLLAWLAREPAASRGDALGPLRARHDQRANAAALLLAKERERFSEILEAFDASEVRWSAFRSPHDRFDEATLVAFALSESGCTRAEIESADLSVSEGDEPAECAAWSGSDSPSR